jgi:HEAT repeat protein
MIRRSLTVVPALLVAVAGFVRAQTPDPTAPTPPLGREPAELAEAARTVLAKSIYAPEEWIRLAALRAAACVADEPLAAAAHAAAHSHDRYERAMALEIVIAGDPIGGQAVLLDALESSYREHRLRALHALEPLHDPALAEAFTRRLRSDPDEDLRALAARALARTAAPSAAATLQAALQDSSAVVRAEAVRGLVRLGSPAVTALVEQRLATARPERLIEEIQLAGLVPDPVLAVKLERYLEDVEPTVKMSAAAAILAIVNASRIVRR